MAILHVKPSVRKIPAEGFCFYARLAAAKVFFILIALFLSGSSFQRCALAQDTATAIEDRLIGSTFKTMAKAFLAVEDIDKLKKKNIARIIRMDEDKFDRRYAQVYAVIKHLPLGLRSAYKINETMTKEQAVSNIASMNKDKLYLIVEAIPDAVIAERFKRYLKKERQEMQNSNIAAQVSNFWNKAIDKLHIYTSD